MWSSNSVPLNLLVEGGKKKAQIFKGYLTDAKRSFLSPTDSFSLPNKVDVVLELETYSFLPIGPT